MTKENINLVVPFKVLCKVERITESDDVSKNNKTKKYDISFITRYRGLELKAKKYGLDVPDAVIVELVHANDHFKSIKKDFSLFLLQSF
jgi:hypothetical protein